MELFSTKFESMVKTLFEKNVSNIIATVPISKGKPIPLVESLKNSKTSKIFEVTKHNRDTIDTEVMSYLKARNN